MKKLGVIILTGLLWGSFPAIAAYADHDDGGCWDGECGGQEYEGNWSNEDRNRNRNRDRGAFSPGPFRDSPVDAFNNLCAPGATCTYNPPPEREQPS